LKTKLDKVRLK